MLLPLVAVLSASVARASDMQACMVAQEAATYEAWADYLQANPGGACAASPSAIDARDCGLAIRADSPDAWRRYLIEHQDGLCVERARQALPPPDEPDAEGFVPSLPRFGTFTSSMQSAPGPAVSDDGARQVVGLGEAIVLGAHDLDGVAAVLSATTAYFGRCYLPATSTNPELSGDMVVRASIRPDGTVARARLRSSTLEHSAVEDCVLRVVRRLSFPVADDRSMITWSVAFTPGGQDPA